MRAILIDWLVEVHLKFKVRNSRAFGQCHQLVSRQILCEAKLRLTMQLMPETLFLTTNLIDRFLAKQPVTRKNLQLVSDGSNCDASPWPPVYQPLTCR